jgi:hypothetical protein
MHAANAWMAIVLRDAIFLHYVLVRAVFLRSYLFLLHFDLILYIIIFADFCNWLKVNEMT